MTILNKVWFRAYQVDEGTDFDDGSGPPPPPPPPTTVFDDFELGNFSRWDTAGSSMAITGSVVYEGVFAAEQGQISATEVPLEHEFTGSYDVAYTLGVYVLVPSATLADCIANGSNFINFNQFSGDIGDPNAFFDSYEGAFIHYDGSQWNWSGYWTSTDTSATPFTPDVWVHVVMTATLHADATIDTVLVIDGTTLINDVGVSAFDPGPPRGFWIGDQNDSPRTLPIYFDYVEWSGP